MRSIVGNEGETRTETILAGSILLFMLTMSSCVSFLTVVNERAKQRQNKRKYIHINNLVVGLC